VHAELWYCAAPAAKVLPLATVDGTIGPGGFQAGQDATPAIRVRLLGTLTVYAPPVSLSDLREEESGYAFHYRIQTAAGTAATIDLDVSKWHKSIVQDCGEFY
jgi:hypothetical protein